MLARLNRKTTAVLSGVTASLLVATGAAAGQQDRPVVVYAEPQQHNVERVPYGDLNLAASADRKTLFGRVGNAVRNVCNFDSAGVSSDYRTCSAISWKDARPQIAAAIASADQLALTGKPAIGATAILVRSR